MNPPARCYDPEPHEPHDWDFYTSEALAPDGGKQRLTPITYHCLGRKAHTTIGQQG